MSPARSVSPIETLRRQATRSTHRIHSLPQLVLMPHSRCNCRCVMCDIWQANAVRKELTREDLLPHVADLIARKLPGIPGLIVPRVLRLRGGKAAQLVEHAGMQFPIIVRRVGMHTGRIVGRFDDMDALRAAPIEGGEHLATKFVDFRSADLPMGTLTIRLDDKLERELARLAEKTGGTKSEVARDALRRQLTIQRFRVPSRSSGTLMSASATWKAT